ncbi:hypothetical protein [Aquimarina sp. MMG016]|uniref:hypothetical protein n=1 Tax=Aquimarina sp. MMG016 TaxID=2822690 RepID=UPI001B39F57A|nr:hypothetical protein [Aquimarina sp. MMG016]MBQ4819201.1 hypothetical protein [Aquimarina sp. MMG016]
MLDFLKEANWWCLLLLLLLAFLLGWILSRWASNNKYKAALDKCEREKNKLRNTNFTKAKTTFSSHPPEEVLASNNEIKAIKTRDRDGSPSGEKPQLNFASFGKADASQKDDLKLISGVGPFIEEKLNGIGIYTFEQISKFTKEDIETVTELIQFFPGRIERDNWTDQANKLKNK